MISRRFAITAPSESKAASKCCSYFFGFHFSRTLVSWNAAGWYVLFQAPMLEAWPMDGPGIFLEIPSVCRRHFKTQGFFPVAPIYLHLFGPGAPKDGKINIQLFNQGSCQRNNNYDVTWNRHYYVNARVLFHFTSLLLEGFDTLGLWRRTLQDSTAAEG